MSAQSSLSRRVFLTRAAGLTLTLGSGGLVLPAWGRAARDPYAGGAWLAGDHHIHTKYSPDGQYEIAQQIAQAKHFGLGWCVITDHGGPSHDKVALTQAYPELVAARKMHPEILVFQGMEWNIPSAEHGSLILPPTQDEAQRIAYFESHYDEKNETLGIPHNTEADAVAGVKYLQSLTPKPLFMANHPARRGIDSPHEMRAWNDAGPDVAHGFEGAPGHAACTLVGKLRGEYDNKPTANSFKGYPEEAYRTFGGYDWYTAKVGGLWDSLLGEGRRWYITADSDSHRHFDDRHAVDTSTYKTKGYVTVLDSTVDKAAEGDFYPGEYSKTWVFAPKREPLAILDSLRNGNMFTVLGGLIDRLELWAHDADQAAPMGGTLAVAKRGSAVTVVIKVRVPKGPNGGAVVPQLHHIDLIAGDILGPATDRDDMTNPTTKVVIQLQPSQAQREGDMLVFRHTFSRVDNSFYVRVRGTNTVVDAPTLDAPDVNPWQDLWFYSNPVFIKVPGK